MPSISATYLLYTCALQLSYIFLRCPVDQEAYVSEQIKDPVMFE